MNGESLKLPNIDEQQREGYKKIAQQAVANAAVNEQEKNDNPDGLLENTHENVEEFNNINKQEEADVPIYDKEKNEQERSSYSYEQECEDYLKIIEDGELDIKNEEQAERFNGLKGDKNLRDRVFLAAAKGTINLHNKKKMKEYIDYFGLAKEDPIKLMRVFNRETYAGTDSTSMSRYNFYKRLQDDNEIRKSGFGITYDCVDYLLESDAEWHDNCKKEINKELELFVEKIKKLCNGEKKTIWLSEAKVRRDENERMVDVDVFEIDDYESNYPKERTEIWEEINESILDIVSSNAIKKKLAQNDIKLREWNF